MKQIIIIACTLVLILGLNFIQNSFLEDSSKILISKLYNLEQSIINEDEQKQLQSKLKELDSLWNKNELGFGVFCEHDAVQGIKESISNINKYVFLFNMDKNVKTHLLIEAG